MSQASQYIRGAGVEFENVTGLSLNFPVGTYYAGATITSILSTQTQVNIPKSITSVFTVTVV